MEEHEPLGPPELGGDPKPTTTEPKSPVPQLVNSKPTIVPKPVAADIPDEPFYEDEPDPLNEHVAHPGDPDGVVAAEEKEIWQKSQRNTEADEPIIPIRKKRVWLRVLITFVILIILTIAAYAIGSHVGAPEKPQRRAATATTTKKKTVPVKPAAVPTKSYVSSNFSLAFSYPGTWKVVDTPAKLTVTSPAVKLMNVSGGKVDTTVVLTVQKKQTTIPGYPQNGAVEILPPYVLAYDRPSPIQSGQTYVTYAGYDSDQDGLDAIFITGDNGYVQHQLIPESDVVAADPLVTVTFTTCPDTSCAEPAAAAVQASTWSSTAISKDVTSILKSLQFQ